MLGKTFSELMAFCLTTGAFILLVALCRCLFRRAPHRVFVLLWILVGFRLMIPVSIESPFSLRGYLEEQQSVENVSTRPDVREASESPRPYAKEHAGALADAVIVQRPEAAAAVGTQTPENVTPVPSKGLSTKRLAGLVWLLGASAVLLAGVVRYLLLRIRLRDAVRLSGEVWQSDKIETPFLFGILRPRVYVPFSIGEKLPYVLLHERTHRKNGDYIVKPLWYVLLALYWFHPLVWLAYALLGRDMELACDERVIVGMDSQEKSCYARALFEISVGKKPLALCPLAFGEVGVKMRIKHILNENKPAVVGMVVCIAVCLVFAVVLLTDPKPSDAQNGLGESESQTQNPVSESTETQDENADNESTQEPGTGEQEKPSKKPVDIVYFGDAYKVDLNADGEPETVTAKFYLPENAQSQMQPDDAMSWNGVLSIVVEDGSTGVRTTGSFAADMYGQEPEGAAVWENAEGISTEGELGYLMDSPVDCYYMIDLDPDDSYVEIGIFERGPSDDPATWLVRYENGKLETIGSFTANPMEESTQIPGDGSVRAVTRCDILQTDWILGTWRIKGGMLVYEEPQEGEFLSCEMQYESENAITAKRDFTAHLQDWYSSAVASVSSGTKIAIQGFLRDGDHIIINFYYKNEDGERVDAYFIMDEPFGRITLINESVDSADELLEGLSFAG